MINKERLLLVARVLREAKTEPRRYDVELNTRVGFDMSVYGHTIGGCLSPSCVLGHFASRLDVQDFIKLVPEKRLVNIQHAALVVLVGKDEAIHYAGERVRDYFGISQVQAEYLFGPDGCGGAEDPIAAAEYIEGFVEGTLAI